MEAMMNSIFEWFKVNGKDIPLYFLLLVFGGLGAAFSNYSSKKELTKGQRFVSIVSGAFTALFVAVFLEIAIYQMWEMRLSGAAMAGIGYFSGHIGLEGVSTLIAKRFGKKKEDKKEDE